MRRPLVARRPVPSLKAKLAKSVVRSGRLPALTRPLFDTRPWDQIYCTLTCNPQNNRVPREIQTSSLDCLKYEAAFRVGASVSYGRMCSISDVQRLRVRVRRTLHNEYGAKTLETSWTLQFRLRLTDPTLSRFLEDEKGDINRASGRVVAWLRWREEHEVDQLVNSWPQLDGLPLLMRSYWPGCLLSGHDHDGCPIQFTRFGCIDFVSLVRYGMVDAAVIHSIYLNELAATRDPSGRQVMIFDFGCAKYEPTAVKFDMEMSRCALIFLRAMAAVFGPNYPCTVKALLVTRAPPAFWLAWRTARSFGAFFPDWLEPRLRVFSDAALPQLLEYMPLDSVPACLGGNDPVYPMINTGGYLQQRSDGCVGMLRLHPWSPVLRANRESVGVRLWEPNSPEAAEDDRPSSDTAERYFSVLTIAAIRAEGHVVPGKLRPPQRFEARFDEHPLSQSALRHVREMLHALRHGQGRPW